jgi:peptidoglycan/LPS O-acetylase OafA/YrhL
MKTLPNLTSLRLFLALFVVIFHIPQFCRNQGFPFFDALPIFHKGSQAVYVFFSLSGFLIIRQLYLEKKTTNSVSLKRFFLRRILRIFPLYYLILVVGFFFYRYLLPTLGYDFENNYNLTEGILLSVFFLPNVFANLYHPGGIIEVLWSIGIEEQFYLFIAPIMLFMPNKKTVYFLILFTIIYFVVFFLDYFPALKRFSMYFFYFSSSGVVSILILKYKSFRMFYNVKFYTVVITFIVYFATSIFETYLSEMLYHLFSMVLFAVFISILSCKPVAILENKAIKYLGKISFGIYMFHAIVMQLVGFVFIKLVYKIDMSKTAIVLYFYLGVILITIFMAHLSYRYYETFFLNLKGKFRTKRIAAGNSFF